MGTRRSSGSDQLRSPAVSRQPKRPLVLNSSIGRGSWRRVFDHPRGAFLWAWLGCPGLTFELWTPQPCDLQTNGMSFVFQQERTGAEIAYSRAAEAVEAAPWPRQKQTPVNLVCVRVKPTQQQDLESPRGPFPALDVSYDRTFGRGQVD